MNKQTRAIAKALQQIVTIIILLTAVVVFIDLRRVSTGIVPPVLDAAGQPIPGSIAEKVRIPIDDRELGMILRGKASTDPLLLFLQDGSAPPGFVFSQAHPTGLEEHFLVAWWDGRGTGLSYDPKPDPQSVTEDTYIRDVVAVSEYLRARFGRDRIYLMAHGAASLLGIRAAQARPDLFQAYIGMSQTAGSPLGRESGTLIYQKLLGEFQQRGDQRSLDQMAALALINQDGTVQFPERNLQELDGLKHRAGVGTLRKMRSRTRGFLESLARSPAYTLREKMDVWQGMAFLKETPLAEANRSADLLQEGIRLEIPVHFLSGVHDYRNPWPLAGRLLDEIQAPEKGFHLFQQSAAGPLWEEPAEVLEVLMEDVLQDQAAVTDKNSP